MYTQYNKNISKSKFRYLNVSINFNTNVRNRAAKRALTHIFVLSFSINFKILNIS